MRNDDLLKSLDLQLLRARQAADELRVNLHLARMDARTAWSDLTPRLHEAERLAREVTEVSLKAASEIAARFREFRTTLGDAQRPWRH